LAIYSIALRLRRQIMMNKTTTASTPETIRTTIVVSILIPPFGFTVTVAARQVFRAADSFL
jgi:hypothetical protein